MTEIPSADDATTTGRRGTPLPGPAARGALPAHTIKAIMRAEHGDPFAVLGPHRPASGLVEIRALLPQATAVAVVGPDGDTSTAPPIAPMELRHDGGFFVARFAAREIPAYRLRVETRSGTYVAHDPYRFGAFLSEGEIASLRQAQPPAGTGVSHVLGAHPRMLDGVEGWSFAVWAPNARRVSVIGDFNAWDGRVLPMRLRHEGGVWELFVPKDALGGIAAGALYKFEIKGADGGLHLKADPVAFAAEHPPATASILTSDPRISWTDHAWMASRDTIEPRRAPVSIYECHLGSWARVPEENNRYLTYRELAERLIPYVKEMGFTHIELLPITEYPFDGSWGYQPVSLFAPTSRFGSPEDFAFFVDAAHRAGIGLLLDWVPGHFPNDPHGLARFDGSHLYEHADPRQGFHQDWGTCIYNYGREEVCAFLVDNARFWLQRFHLDGLRVDAVASMLYLDYSRKAGEWVPNRYGGNENLEAIDFLRRMNEAAYAAAPGIFTVAEESTAWPGVSRPTYAGGLGFGFKWNMGWMHDTLRYIGNEPVHRRWHHNDLTFGLLYAFSENYILPISHDEVVHGKGSLLARMPGDGWQRFANLRAYLGFMFGHPGKKLLFMGCEFAQEREWNHDASLDWHLLYRPEHAGVRALVRDLNHAYRTIPALYEQDTEAAGFRWLVEDDTENSVIVWLRRSASVPERAEDAAPGQLAIVAANFMPVPHHGYRVGVPAPGEWREVVNTDACLYGGSNVGNDDAITAEAVPSHGQPWSISLTLPPLGTLILER